MDKSVGRFQQENTLTDHIFSILDFYYPACIDKDKGGYNNGFLDDGTINDYMTKHLVGTSRFIYSFSIGALLGGSKAYTDAAKHGIHFLKQAHKDNENGGYYFELSGLDVKDDRKIAYGHAFALLAASIAYQAGIEEAKELLDDIYDVLERNFWDEEHEFYREEWNKTFTEVSSYRGQNPNMHLCEATLTAYEATGEEKYLKRAYRLAYGVTQELASRAGGMVWEHYTTDWEPDWEYNKNHTKDEFRPYGFLPGHQLEWSKLLLWLDRHRSEPWMLDTAKKLFQKGWSKGIDETYGGLFFALSPEEDVIDEDKNYWVIAEAISAASLLGAKTGIAAYWASYVRLFAYASSHFIDHHYGGWYTLLDRSNKAYSTQKTAAPKADYHPIAACYQTILALQYKK